MVSALVQVDVFFFSSTEWDGYFIKRENIRGETDISGSCARWIKKLKCQNIHTVGGISSHILVLNVFLVPHHLNKQTCFPQSSAAPSVLRTLSWTWAVTTVKTRTPPPSWGSEATAGCWRWRRMRVKRANLCCELAFWNLCFLKCRFIIWVQTFCYGSSDPSQW